MNNMTITNVQKTATSELGGPRMTRIRELVLAELTKHPEKVYDTNAIRNVVYPQIGDIGEDRDVLWALRYMVNKKHIKRVGRGEYAAMSNSRVAFKGYAGRRKRRLIARKKPVASRSLAAVTAKSRAVINGGEDTEALNNALQALVTLEEVIQKHAALEKKLLALGVKITY